MLRSGIHSLITFAREIVVGTNGNASFPDKLSFKCAVTDAKGPRRFMEDAHSIVVPYGGIHGQGFFAIFDGHAGKHAAEWCGQNFSVVRILYRLTTTSGLRRHPACV